MEEIFLSLRKDTPFCLQESVERKVTKEKWDVGTPGCLGPQGSQVTPWSCAATLLSLSLGISGSGFSAWKPGTWSFWGFWLVAGSRELRLGVGQRLCLPSEIDIRGLIFLA